MSWLWDSASHIQDICSGVKLLVPPKERLLMLTIFALAAVLQVDSSCGYWGLPFDEGVRFCGWCDRPRPDIDVVLPYWALRWTAPIWLLQSLFGDDSWSELSDILGWCLRRGVGRLIRFTKFIRRSRTLEAVGRVDFLLEFPRLSKLTQV